MFIQNISEEHRNTVNKILKEEWDAPPVVSKGRAIDTTLLPGFICFSDDNDVIGLITYHIENSACEIITLNSFEENKGIGTALVKSVLSAAKTNNCCRLWLITTNDNINALRFYQKKGFELIEVHMNAIDISRELKPSIPLTGMNNIPIKHEFEFEMKI